MSTNAPTMALPAPFAAPAPAGEDALAATGFDADATYALIRRASIDPSEVEELGTEALEVSVLWKSTILHVAHLPPERGFALVSTGRLEDPSTFVVDESMLPAGVTSVPLVAAGAPRVVVPAGSKGEAERDGKRVSVEDLLASGEAAASSEFPGAREVAMRAGERYRVEIAGLTVIARLVPRARKLPAAARRDRRFIATGVGALLAVAGLVGAMRLGTSDDGMLSADSPEDRLAALRDFVQQQRDREPPPVQTQQGATEGAAAPAATAAAGTEGRAGRRDTAQRNGHVAVARHADVPAVGLPPVRERVAGRGIMAALGQSTVLMGGEGYVSPFSGMGSGDAPADTMGVDGLAGDGWGTGGLGRVGTGFGGGGTGDVIQVGMIGTRGVTCTTASCEGGRYGVGRGTRLGPASTGGPILRTHPPTITGGLAPELIRRVVLRNLGQVSHCQEQGLHEDPRLAGRVVVRFVIGSDGNVLGARVVESNLSVPSVSVCIERAVQRWSFNVPSDFSGTATVTYPFALSPAE